MGVLKDRWIHCWDLENIEDGIPAVYVLYPMNVAPMRIPFYVGQTVNLRSRLSAHRDRFGPVQFKVKFPRKYGAHLMIEARLIRRLGGILINAAGNPYRHLRAA